MGPRPVVSPSVAEAILMRLQRPPPYVPLCLSGACIPSPPSAAWSRCHHPGSSGQVACRCFCSCLSLCHVHNSPSLDLHVCIPMPFELCFGSIHTCCTLPSSGFGQLLGPLSSGISSWSYICFASVPHIHTFPEVDNEIAPPSPSCFAPSLVAQSPFLLRNSLWVSFIIL